MNKKSRLLIDLINTSIYDKKIEDINIYNNEEFSWREIKEEVREHNCMALIFPAIKKLQEGYECIPKEIYEEWEKEVIELAAAQCIKNYELNDTIKLINNNCIECGIFKGAVIADTYPEYLLRISGDADILIDKENEEKAIQLLIDNGYIINYAASKENVTTLFKGDILVIELHTSLWEDYKGEIIDKLNEINISDKNLYRDFIGCDIKTKTLGVTKHFTYLFYHMIKHFIPGGIGIRHFIDIALFYNRYENEINLEEFFYNMKELGYDMFCKCTFKICIDLFEMKSSALDDEFRVDNELYNKLLEDIFDAGVFGNKTIDRIKSRNVIKQTYYESNKQQPSKVRVIINTLFPKPEAMSSKYVNARKYKILLPVAWTQRAIYHVVNKAKNSDEPSLTKKTKLVEDRIKLLKELNLMK